MKPGQATFISGVALGLAVGLAVGHLLFAARGPQPLVSEAAAPRFVWSVDEASGGVTALDEAASSPLEFDGDTQYFPPPPDESESHALFADATDVATDDTLDGRAEPEVFPPAAATPIQNAAAADPRLRGIIEAELKSATPQEVDIWLDAMQGLPSEDVVGILRLWKEHGIKFGRLPGMRSGLPADAAPIASPSTSPPPARTPPARSASGADPATEHVRAVLLNNLVHSETIGFKRTEPLVGDPFALATGVAPPLLGTRLDLTPGAARPTGNPLDLAIVDVAEPSGTEPVDTTFFAVSDGKTTWYTRCGMFTLDKSRRIVTDGGPRPLVLQPEIVLPEDSHRLRIAQDGRVTAVRGEAGEAEEIGWVMVAGFVNPGALQPIGPALFASTPASGPGHLVLPFAASCRLKQGVLEQSNAPAVAERARLERLQHRRDATSTPPTVLPVGRLSARPVPAASAR